MGMDAMLVHVPCDSASVADVNARREVIIVASMFADCVFIFGILWKICEPTMRSVKRRRQTPGASRRFTSVDLNSALEQRALVIANHLWYRFGKFHLVAHLLNNRL